MIISTIEHTKQAIEAQFTSLSDLTSTEQIQLSFSTNGWPTTRAWIIAPERLPYFPKFMDHVEAKLESLQSALPNVLDFFHNLPYHSLEFWEQLSRMPIETQLEHFLNCCALSLITDRLPPSDARDTLIHIQHVINGHVLDTPDRFLGIQQLAAQLKSTLSPSSRLHEYLLEFDAAFEFASTTHPNLLKNALRQIQERLAVTPKQKPQATWAQRFLDAADQLSENIMDIFNQAVTVQMATAFTNQSNAQSSHTLWSNDTSELSVLQLEDQTFIKWTGNHPLQALAVNNEPLQCHSDQTFQAHAIQYWGPVNTEMHRIQFFDGSKAYQMNITGSESADK